MSRQGKILVLVSLAAALVVLVPLSLRLQAQWDLRSCRKKLIASGEKLTVEELAPKRNRQAANTALFLKLAANLPSLLDCSPAAMRSIKPGVARVAWRQPRCMEKMDDSKPAFDVWPAFMDAVRTNETKLRELRALVDAGDIELISDYTRLNLDETAFLPQVKQTTVDFSALAVLALHQGRLREACHYLKSCGATCQLIAKDPLMIDQLVCYACMAIVMTGCWEALQAGGWTDDQLAQLQHQWDQSAILADAESSIAMERARAPMEYQAARASRDELNDMPWGSGIPNNAEIWNDFLLDPRAGWDELLTAHPRYWGWRWIGSYRNEQRYLEFMQTMIEATRDAQKRRPILSFLKDRDKSGFIFPSPATNQFDLLGPTIGITETFVGQALRAQTVANMVAAAIALERFRLAHHVYPADLANLTPEFMQTVPVDCMDGRDLRYRLNPDGTYLLYSVGDDGVDSGGDPTPKEGEKPNFFRGRDLVWPRPATAEEVQACETEQTKPIKRP